MVPNDFNCNEARDLERWARTLVDSGVFSSVALVGRRGEVGFAARAGGAEAGSLFDLASLTKPFLATTALWLAARDELDLKAPVFPEAACWRLLNPETREPVTLDLLVRHLSGALAWWPLDRLDGADVLSAPLWGHERGVYSDIGYLTAARWIEAATGQPLWTSIERCLQDLLPELIANEDVVPVTAIESSISRVLPCAMDTAKEVELGLGLGLELPVRNAPRLGGVQDGNARFLACELGQLAGHAGLFGTTEAVVQLGELWMNGPMRRVADTRMRELMGQALEAKGGRLQGWFRGPDSDTGFFHTGFTGGGVWVDRDLSCVVVMLGHRINPIVSLAPVRSRFRELAHAALSQ